MVNANTLPIPELVPDGPELTEQEKSQIDIFSQAVVLALDQKKVFGLIDIKDPFNYVMHSSKDPRQRHAVYRDTIRRMDKVIKDAQDNSQVLTAFLSEVDVPTEETPQPDEAVVHKALKSRPDIVKIISGFIKTTPKPEQAKQGLLYAELFKKAVQSPVGMVSRPIRVLAYVTRQNVEKLLLPQAQLGSKDRFKDGFSAAKSGSQAAKLADRKRADEVDNWG